MLGGLQADLQSIYRVDSPLAVADFAIDRVAWTGLHRAATREELLVREQDGDLEVALYVDDDVLRAIDQPSLTWTASRLDAHCLAVEGVSHFLYLTHRAQQPRPVSQLELELQAEIDKFATIVLALWADGRREATFVRRRCAYSSCSVALVQDAARRGRARSWYRQANFLASLYCRFLEAKYVVRNSIDGFLGDLRRMYRLGAAEKLSYAACGAAL